MRFERKRSSVSAISESGRKEREVISSTVETNLLFEILQELKKLNKPIKTKLPKTKK